MYGQIKLMHGNVPSTAGVETSKIGRSSEKNMRSTTKKRPMLSASNAKKLDDLCAWIIDNCNQTLGWTQLTKRSGLTKEQICELFLLYRQVTPMAFIRQASKQHNNIQIINLQTQLFDRNHDH